MQNIGKFMAESKLAEEEKSSLARDIDPLINWGFNKSQKDWNLQQDGGNQKLFKSYRTTERVRIAKGKEMKTMASRVDLQTLGLITSWSPDSQTNIIASRVDFNKSSAAKIWENSADFLFNFGQQGCIPIES